MKLKFSKKDIVDAVFVTIGCMVLAISINIFLLPAKISTGGATGVGNILYHLYNIPVSLTVLIINIPLFIIALKVIGIKFCFRAIYGTLLLILFIQLAEPISNISWLNLSNDLFLSSIFGGILSGLGISLVFKGGGSTGGSDLLAQIIYKARSLSSISQVILVIDGVIITLTIIAFKSVMYGLYSIVALYISNKVIDIVFEGINYSKVINVITKKGKKVSDEIIAKLDKGVTTSNCIGEYTDENYTHLITVVGKQEIAIVKSIVREIDNKAFMYISSASEVAGTGFNNKN